MVQLDLHAIPRTPLMRAMAERPWYRRVSKRSYVVTGRTLSHGRYTVTFWSDNGRKFASCTCPHHQWTQQFCKHMGRVIYAHLRNMAKAQLKKAA